MVLRRVIDHVREQNWTAIGIDFVIVVLGVFVGIQVSNWNASRLEAQRAQGYLERIAADLAEDVSTLERRGAFWKKVIAYGRVAIDYAEQGTLAEDSAWKTVLAFYQASQLYPYVPADTTYLELRSAGNLGLIADHDVRAALAGYYVGGTGYAANALFRAEPEYRKVVRGLTPTVASTQVWAKCHRTDENADQFLFDCDSPMSEQAARDVLDAYMADPRLLPELRFWITNLEVMASLISKHQAAAQKLAARLQKAHST